MERSKPAVGVAGAAECGPDIYALAEAVGKAIAERGGTLVCGGRLGVMEAAAKGARSAGGSTVGILPGTSREEANRYIELAICTGLGQARNLVFVLSVDVLIAVAGEYGTLSEIALALKHRIPVVGLKSWELPGLESEELFAVAESPAEAVELAFALAERRGRGPRGISRGD